MIQPVVVTGLVLLAALWLAAWIMQDQAIFPTGFANQRVPSGPPRPDIERVWVQIDPAAPENRVEAWFLPGIGRSASSPGPAVMFFHGNGTLIDYSLDYADLYTGLGVSVLLPEYRGYGRSGGSPSQRGIAADMVRFREWLDARAEVDPTRIIYHGQSLGGGVAADLAAVRPPAALILQSTFTSVTAIALRFGVPPFVLRHPFRTDQVLPRLRCPMLIVHGREDEIIPVLHGRRLHELAPRSRYAELDGRHNDFPRDWDEFGELIGGFLGEAGLLP